MADGDDAARKSFDLIDSAVFAGMLGISAIVGVYYAYKSRKNADAVREYLVGGQNMSIFPISMSLIASYISGISILGLPAEMYVFGTQFWCGVISDSFVSLTMAFVYLPVFYGLGITSSYEYLKLRFNDAVRLMGCVIFLIKMGGLKAVVWTDAIQTIVMFGGVIIVAVYGTHRVGGFDVVWQRNRDTDRIEFFNMDLDPTTRHTFWSVVVGNYLNWLASCSVNQAMVQRCLAMPNLKMANATITIMAIGIIIIVSLCCYTGLVVFAAFHDCDPVKTKQIGKSDQLLPFYVMELSTSIPGLPGLFVACVFSAALSTMSTGLNSMSGVIFEDMIKPWLRGPISDTAASRTMKATVIVIGIVCMALVFLVEKLGGLIQAGKSLSSITAGPLLGMFTLGMFFPSANSAGAMVGGLVGLALVAWISLGTQAAVSTGEIVFPAKPVSIEGCPESIKNRVGNLTTIADIVSREQPFLLYRMSYLWYTWVGFLIAISIGLLVSWITGSNRCKPGDEKLYTPAVRRFLRSKVDASTQRIRAFDKVSMELGKVEMDGVEEPVRNPAVFRDTRNPP
ncbi:sodium-coupled monocarboxylate transporter 2 isoform X3 [Augochlora pura]